MVLEGTDIKWPNSFRGDLIISIINISVTVTKNLCWWDQLRTVWGPLITPWPQRTPLLGYQHVIPFPVTPKQRCDCLWLSSSSPTVPSFASKGLGSIVQIRTPPPLHIPTFCTSTVASWHAVWSSKHAVELLKTFNPLKKSMIVNSILNFWLSAIKSES